MPSKVWPRVRTAVSTPELETELEGVWEGVRGCVGGMRGSVGVCVGGEMVCGRGESICATRGEDAK